MVNAQYEKIYVQLLCVAILLGICEKIVLRRSKLSVSFFDSLQIVTMSTIAYNLTQLLIYDNLHVS